ncbi:hypothetical protein PACTADRAFT_49110 [Pachysolen tannophilus NRRL Y-2460]|uniref:Golgi apyrase n=1 Tax=Pachysolen tannophilus NRRL Y-2460 TaxID=669874 RepID=A0A1E4U073_PACTA|nr:hypothetical protein PACTADRAFT_49110 [Pachysolen tannophilus NRRL Y-2460]
MDIKEKRKQEQGPVKNSEGIPYNYIIIIDAGSKGSRAYIYNWLDAKTIYSKTIDDDREDLKKKNLNLNLNLNLKFFKRIDVNLFNDNQLPAVGTESKWFKKIKPGLSTFNKQPKDSGNHHIKYLLESVSKIIPILQHNRTPIFLHATAGLRLLPPEEQKNLLNQVCKYILKNYKFYLPDCSSHINIIDGDVEGLYGWIALNYLMDSLEISKLNHNNEKSHSTYGLLDMGGGSTQISFQPNASEETAHSNALFNLQLASLGHSEPDLNVNVFASSFLGYGLTQARETYIERLKKIKQIEIEKIENNALISDSCLPKGYLDQTNSIIGSGNFSDCMQLIYPLLITSETPNSSSCLLTDPQDISSCLLSDDIPSLNFSSEKFIGVSGYWDAVSHLLNIDKNVNMGDYGNAYSYESFSLETEKICNMPWQELDRLNNNYKINKKNSETSSNAALKDLTDEELADLCFRSSWILSILHRGLGFPKANGLDTAESNDNDTQRIAPFRVADKIHGSEFTWTLGRAVLYSSGEAALAYAEKYGLSKPKIGYYHNSSPNLFVYGAEVDGVSPRPVFTERQNAHYDDHDDDNNDDDNDNENDDDDDDDDDSMWDSIDDIHKGYTSLILLVILLLIVYFMLGSTKRTLIIKAIKKTLNNALKKFKKSPVIRTITEKLGGSYRRINNSSSNNKNGDIEMAVTDFELNEIEGSSSDARDNIDKTVDETFVISDGEEEEEEEDN